MKRVGFGTPVDGSLLQVLQRRERLLPVLRVHGVPLQAPGVAAPDLRRVQQGVPHLLRFPASEADSGGQVVLSALLREAASLLLEGV